MHRKQWHYILRNILLIVYRGHRVMLPFIERHGERSTQSHSTPQKIGAKLGYCPKTLVCGPTTKAEAHQGGTTRASGETARCESQYSRSYQSKDQNFPRYSRTRISAAVCIPRFVGPTSPGHQSRNGAFSRCKGIAHFLPFWPPEVIRAHDQG